MDSRDVPWAPHWGKWVLCWGRVPLWSTSLHQLSAVIVHANRSGHPRAAICVESHTSLPQCAVKYQSWRTCYALGTLAHLVTRVHCCLYVVAMPCVLPIYGACVVYMPICGVYVVPICGGCVVIQHLIAYCILRILHPPNVSCTIFLSAPTSPDLVVRKCKQACKESKVMSVAETRKIEG